MPSSVFGTFYNDSSDNLGQISPGFSPSNGMSFPGDGDDRRPSIASATTVSSSGSKSSVSGKFHKKLQGFFGDEYKGLEEPSRQTSESSSIQGAHPGLTPTSTQRDRNNSVNDGTKESGPPSPSNSRPRTPAQQGPSYDVTPWAFQDSQVSLHSPNSRHQGRHFQAAVLTRVFCCRMYPTRPFPLNKVTAAQPPRVHHIRTGCTYLAIDTTGAMRKSTTLNKDLVPAHRRAANNRSVCARAPPWHKR